MSSSDTNLLITGRALPKSPSGNSADTAPISVHGEQHGGYEYDEEDEIAKAKGKECLEDPGQIQSQLASAGFFSSSVNLLKTLIGAGLLSLPFAFALVGVVPGAALLLIATVLSIFGYYLLAKASYTVCDRTGSFAALSAVTYPRLTPVFDMAVALKCLGIAVGYLKIIGDLLPETIKAFKSNADDGAWYLNRILWVSAIVTGIAPITFMKRMDSLKYTSFLGMISVAYLLVLSIVMWIQTIGETGRLFGYGDWVAKLSMSSFRAFPIMVFAFGGHQNLFPIQNEARKNDPKSMMAVINFCVWAALLIYLLFATGSYATFNSDPLDDPINANIINNYPTNGAQYVLARFLYIFLLTFSYPMVTYPARESIFKILGYYFPVWYPLNKRVIYFTIATLVLLFTWLIACINPPLDFVLGLIGATAAPFICFFLPALFWLKIDSGPNRVLWIRWACYGMIGFSLVSTCLSLASLILSVAIKS